MKKTIRKMLAVVLSCVLFTGCGAAQKIDDYATNEGEQKTAQTAEKEETKAKIKIGVIHLADPAEGSGYTYTHDLGIQGMQQNLGLSDDQIIRKNNVSDTDEKATEEAIQDCVDEGCKIIFATSWGYMKKVAEMAEKYPDVYFSHGTGYMSNGKNFNNYFGRIY